MARERSNFETYSMCYEHVLQHAREKLSQREQEVDLLRRSQLPPEDCAGQEQLCPLEQASSGTLAAIVCKMQSLGRWRLAVQQARLTGQLSRAEKESIHSQRECLRIKLMAEQEVGLLHQQLLAARQALAEAHTDNRKLRQQQDTQAQLLRELEHRVTQDSVTRQQLEIIKTSGMEKLLEDVEQKEQQLQLLTAEAERASKLGQLRWRKMDRDLQQMRSRLAQERSVKLDAFHRVRELQSQLHDMEQPSLQMGSSSGCPTFIYFNTHLPTNSQYTTLTLFIHLSDSNKTIGYFLSILCHHLA
ncbi:Coiled-coil domain-containing protein C6orf185-like [Cricetulus griseus]|uniref:Coiled-coil domain-containing protein C6orf185-like n=1 Tax=Cricetulus griseus TaxID=10029 RepID=G3GXL4_CRIGR|nr:Coiled-coil domain-containing protein C6orf185-like [Cricetulus griseus]ERE82374.1 coiled-coil domain-containing protein [Cricetulus griseus]